MVAGLDELAVDFKIGVSFKNTSFKYAFVYAVEVRSVIPSFDALAEPSISPSETRSRNVANCLLCSVSGGHVGCLGGGGEPPPPAPRIIFLLSVILVLAPYQRHQKLQQTR